MFVREEYFVKHKTDDLKNIIFIILTVLILFIFLYNLCNKSIIGHSPYDSYEKQAQAWLNGEIHLPEDYPWLELAIYEEKYYVSFPPLPSVIMLPFTMIFEENVPNNFIIVLTNILTCIIVYSILRKQKTNGNVAIFIAIGFVVGSNMVSMALDGGVWFIAQSLNMLLCMLAVECFILKKKTLMYLFLSLAVGCRPFSAIYIVTAFIYFCIKEWKTKRNFLKENILPLTPVILIALIYMWYNYIRFDNPFEFGHNYLPEFMNSENGQFSYTYLKGNLKQLFFDFIVIDNKLNLEFKMPFVFFIANPFFIVAFYRAVKNIIKEHSVSLTRLLFTIGMALNIIALCFHKTLGGWQFGARYTCDFLPFAFLCFLIFKSNNKKLTDKCEQPVEELLKGEKIKPIILDRFEIFCIIFGIMLNVCGAIELWT